VARPTEPLPLLVQYTCPFALAAADCSASPCRSETVCACDEAADAQSRKKATIVLPKFRFSAVRQIFFVISIPPDPEFPSRPQKRQEAYYQSPSRTLFKNIHSEHPLTVTSLEMGLALMIGIANCCWREQRSMAFAQSN
jgi:hypothetical protein